MIAQKLWSSAFDFPKRNISIFQNPSVFWSQFRAYLDPASFPYLLKTPYTPLAHTVAGKTTFASSVVRRINEKYADQFPGSVLSAIAVCVPMDGYHLSRAQLLSLPDPAMAVAKRGAAFTFSAETFLALVKKLRDPLLPDSPTLYAPSFDHAIKDPVENDIAIHVATRIVLFEGNYLSLNKGLWKEAASLMDELWFVEVDFDTARRRLVQRHIRSGVAKDEAEANRRITENDFVNGREIIEDRLEVHELIISEDHQG